MRNMIQIDNYLSVGVFLFNNVEVISFTYLRVNDSNKIIISEWSYFLFNNIEVISFDYL